MYELERPDSCSVGRAMEILGERWTFLILRESFYGVRRFSDMQRNLGIARNILSTRLQTLVARGHPRAPPLPGGARALRVPADRGRPRPVSGDRRDHALGRRAPHRRAGPPVVLRHNLRRARPTRVLVCAHCREALHPHDVTPESPASRLSTLNRRAVAADWQGRGAPRPSHSRDRPPPATGDAHRPSRLLPTRRGARRGAAARARAGGRQARDDEVRRDHPGRASSSWDSTPRAEPAAFDTSSARSARAAR